MSNNNQNEHGSAGGVIVLIVLALMVIGALIGGHTTTTNTTPVPQDTTAVSAALKIQGDVCTLKSEGYTAESIITAGSPSVSDPAAFAQIVSGAYANCP